MQHVLYVYSLYIRDFGDRAWIFVSERYDNFGLKFRVDWKRWLMMLCNWIFVEVNVWIERD